MYDPHKVVIFGSSGHAKVIVDIIESNNNFELIGFIDKFIPAETIVLNYKVIGDESILPKLMNEYKFNKGVVGIGASIFHGVSIEDNCIVGGGSILNKDAICDSTYYGIPAKRTSERKLGDSYL